MALRSSRAFTLIELLVSIGVIAVLLGLAVVGLARAREHARTTECLVRLRNIMQAQAVYSSANNDHWANDFTPDQLFIEVVSGRYQSFGITYFDQVSVWYGGLIGTLWSNQDPGEALSCPTAYARAGDWPGEPGLNLFDASPGTGAVASYYQSIAMISDPALWDPAAPDRRVNIRSTEYRKWVRFDEIAFPSAKVTFAERTDQHETRREIWDAGSASFNLALADGSADRRRPADAQSPLPFTAADPMDFPRGTPLPFSSAPHGIRGRDF